MQVPAGWLVGRFGGKTVLCVAVLVWNIATFASGFLGNMFVCTFGCMVSVTSVLVFLVHLVARMPELCDC